MVGKKDRKSSGRHQRHKSNVLFDFSLPSASLSPVIFSPHITSFVLYRWDFPFAPFASPGVYFVKSEKQTHSGEVWVVQRCVWCSFIIVVMVGALEWEWSKVRGSAWWIWRRLTPPCPQQWGSCWSWETRAWSVHRGSKHTKAFLHSDI